MQQQRKLTIGELVCIFIDVEFKFEINKPKKGVVMRALQGRLSDGVFYAGEKLNDHLLCWYSIEGECKPPKAMQKAIYSFSFLTGRISNYVLIVDAETILQDVG